MITPQQERAAQFLAAARKDGRPGARLPEDIRPADLDSALVIQRRVVALLGQQIGGWKCSVPSEARALNIAPIFASTIFRNSPCAIVATGTIARIEPEVAFVMAHDLPKRAAAYTEAEIRNAIAEPRLVLELLGTRYADPAAASWPEMMADFVQNQGLFIGPVFRAAWPLRSNHFPSRFARRPACTRRMRVAMATVIRCGRCTGSPISWRRATKVCARDRSSPRGRTPARSRFRSEFP